MFAGPPFTSPCVPWAAFAPWAMPSTMGGAITALQGDGCAPREPQGPGDGCAPKELQGPGELPAGVPCPTHCVGKEL